MNKNAQAWGIDLTVAAIIFLFGIIIFFVYSLNNSMESKEDLDELKYQGEYAINTILSEGYPNGWSINNIENLGIFSNNRINETKLEQFYNLSISNYPRTKSILEIKYDYFFYFDEMSAYGIEIEGIGKTGTNISDIEAENLLKITRSTIYRNKPKTVYLYIWED